MNSQIALYAFFGGEKSSGFPTRTSFDTDSVDSGSLVKEVLGRSLWANVHLQAQRMHDLHHRGQAWVALIAQ